MTKKISLMLVLSLFVSVPHLFADLRAPEPPADNPHPAVSEADKKRVSFAELVIKHLQTQEPLRGKSRLDLATAFSAKVQLNISEKCLLSAECLKQADENSYIDAFKAHFGPVKTYKHVHIIPWSFEKFQKQRVTAPTGAVNLPNKPSEEEAPLAKSKSEAKSRFMFVPPEILPGEYMIHSYVLFDDTLFNDLKRGWHHLNIIVSEDEKGDLKLQRLYTTPLPDDKLPPGVEC